MPAVLPFYALQFRHLLAPKAELLAICGACKRKATLSVIDLAYKYGPNGSVRNLEKRLKCEGCGHRGWARIQVEWL